MYYVFTEIPCVFHIDMSEAPQIQHFQSRTFAQPGPPYGGGCCEDMITHSLVE